MASLPDMDTGVLFDAFMVFIGGYVIARLVVFTFSIDKWIIEVGNYLRTLLGLEQRNDWI